MRKKIIRLILCLATLSLAFQSGSFGQTSQRTTRKLPDGKWTFSARPYMEPGYDSSPVMVTSTISDLSGTVIGVMLKNNSESLVSAVKLGWSFSTGQAVANSLKQGETPLIAPSGTLSPGKYKELIFPIVNFAEVAAPFVRKGSLDGDYLIEVRVTEVQFEDGTIWTAK